MDPTSDPTVDPAASAAEPEAVPTPEPTSAGADPGPAAGPNDPPPWEGKTPEELWKLNDELRKENVSYKQRFRPWEQSVGVLHPADQALIVNFASALAAGDDQAIAEWGGQLKQALDQMTPAEAKAAVAAVEQAQQQAEEFDPYDPKAIDDRITRTVEQRLAAERAEQERQRAIAEAGQKLVDRSKELGTEHGLPFGDPGHWLHRSLLLRAHNEFQSERDPLVKLDLAARAIAEDLRKQGQELLKTKAADAAPSPAPADAVEPSGARKPTTLREARESAKAHLARILSEQIGT